MGGAGDSVRMLCLDADRGFEVIGSSSKKLLLLRDRGVIGFWEGVDGGWELAGGGAGEFMLALLDGGGGGCDPMDGERLDCALGLLRDLGTLVAISEGRS